MHNEFTAIMERDGRWFVAYCPEIPGANGQGKTKAECLKSLSEAIDLMLADRREDAFRGLPADAMRELVAIGRRGASCGGASVATGAA
jgi:predicted RNase H-like HicB family nuclease